MKKRFRFFTTNLFAVFFAGAFLFSMTSHAQQKIGGNMKTEYIQGAFVMPAVGLLESEKELFKVLLGLHGVLSSKTNCHQIISDSKPILAQVWSNLDRINLSLAFNFTSGGNMDGIAISTPGNELQFAIVLDEDTQKIIFIKIGKRNADDSVENCCLSFFPNGQLQKMIHMNDKNEQIGRYATWNEKGSLLDEGNQTEPVKIKMFEKKR